MSVSDSWGLGTWYNVCVCARAPACVCERSSGSMSPVCEIVCVNDIRVYAPDCVCIACMSVRVSAILSLVPFVWAKLGVYRHGSVCVSHIRGLWV